MNKNQIKGVKPSAQEAFDLAISPIQYSVVKETSVLSTLVVRAPSADRQKVKLDLETKLRRARINFTKSLQGGSVGSTEFKLDNKKIRIIYKPTSGGMSETTLNSTITELVPAIAFMNGKKQFSTVDQLYDFILNAKSGGVYVNPNDEKAGKTFIDQMPDSSKFKDKMQNAMAILKYLWDLHKKMPIKQVYWGYRSKPNNINPSHKGDLFVHFTNNKWLGVSLKAGGEKTKEPQLNTYVNKLYDDYGRSNDKLKLIQKVYNEIHKKLGFKPGWDSRESKPSSIAKLEALKKTDIKRYEDYYDMMLEIIRDDVINTVNKSMKDTIEYIKKQILKKDVNVPLVVVKAAGTSYSFVTDEDSIETFIPQISSIKAYKSGSSKQNWHIDLMSKNSKITMNMSIRSNQPMPNNKLAQGFNLAVKFNGIS